MYVDVGQVGWIAGGNEVDEDKEGYLGSIVRFERIQRLRSSQQIASAAVNMHMYDSQLSQGLKTARR